MLEGGGPVTVCTSDVDREVRELSGTLEIGGPADVEGAALGCNVTEDGEMPLDVETVADVVGDGVDASNAELGTSDTDSGVVWNVVGVWDAELGTSGIGVELVGGGASVSDTELGVSGTGAGVVGGGNDASTAGTEDSGTGVGVAGVENGAGGMNATDKVKARSSGTGATESEGLSSRGGPPSQGFPSDGPPWWGWSVGVLSRESKRVSDIQ